MDLRCLVFSSDDASAPLICQVLAELGAEADHCPDAAAAIGRVASESFQIVIADWDDQENAEYLLKAARARKPNERPLTLAIVSDDPSVPKALQAGANSVLRKPILINQVRDTLETARSLLKAKQDSSANAPSSAAAQTSATAPTNVAANEAHLRAGDFLTSARPTPSAQFDTESELQKEMVPSAAVIDPLKDLEPMAAAVTPAAPAPQASESPVPQSNEPRGLQWYLNQRAPSLPSTPSVPMPAPPPPPQPALMGYDQMAAAPEPAPSRPVEPPQAPPPDPVREQKAEAELFSYITRGKTESSDASEPSGETDSTGPRFRLGNGVITFAAFLAACALIVAPQAPWHPATLRMWAHGARSLHAWLNPQVVAPAQAPESHESFGRAGDEYKLPVPENIPDATTDPTQIRVVPVVDPRAKKTGDNSPPQNDDATSNPADAAQPTNGQTPGTPVQGNAPQSTPGALPPSAAPPQTSGQSASSTPAQPVSSATTPSGTSPTVQAPSTSSPVSQVVNPPAPPQQKPSPVVQVATATPPIPASLRSQMASTVPDSSGNKAPETALPSIEPVLVAEPAERALLTDQPSISYPDAAKGQQGTVILQLLIGRDGSVQDAKFLQGSLAFARAAIDGVRSWKFKPYVMNGRPVSVQTQLTLTFSPTK
jgi:periplasmic protein TonB